MTPFDLSAALSGAKVVTRDGREVTQLVRFDIKSRWRVHGVIDDILIVCTDTGEACAGNCAYDLFMYSEPEEIWEPTMELRWVSGKEHWQRDSLQQKWICGEKSEWRDVPTVREE